MGGENYCGNLLWQSCLTLLTPEKTTEEILALIRKMPRMTMKEMATRCGLTEDGVYWHIKRLREKGELRHVGPKKGGHWEVAESANG